MQLSNNNNHSINIDKFYLNTVVISLTSILLSLAIWGFLWINYSNIIHPVLELFCIFIGLLIITIILNSSNINHDISRILAFGFLISSIFQLLHIYYFENSILPSNLNEDLSFRFWFASRLTVIFTLLIFSLSSKVNKITKPMLCLYFVTLAIPFLYYIDYTIAFSVISSSNELKTFEGISILALLFTLRNIKTNFNDDIIKYEYLFYCIIMLIASQLCFIFFDNNQAFFRILTHLLNVSSYLFLFKALLVDSKKSLYIDLNRYNKKLSYILNTIPTSLFIQNSCIQDEFKYSKTSIEQDHIIHNRIVLDSLPMPIMIINKQGIITSCNKAINRLIEIEKNTIINMHIQKLNTILNYSDRVFSDVFSENIEFNKTISGSILTKSGKTKDIRLTPSPIKNGEDEFIGMVLVAQDISEEKQYQEKLINQEKLALLGQMGATIVHETRNFLTTIKGNSQLIELFATDDRIKSYAKKINKNTDEVNKIISDFLNLSKPRKSQFNEISINDLVSSMKSTLETSSLIKGIDLILDLTKHERYILCDETQIRQVILNICKNAIEAMCDIKDPKLIICTEINEQDYEVSIIISDNGKGIAKEYINKIGTAFFTTKKNGTGLGLNACYQIINDHNGKIQVESELDVGTTFIITFPYIEEDIEELF
ncbi:MAG: ATP-binding protein [Clostridiaceae bacterium]